MTLGDLDVDQALDQMLQRLRRLGPVEPSPAPLQLRPLPRWSGQGIDPETGRRIGQREIPVGWVYDDRGYGPSFRHGVEYEWRPDVATNNYTLGLIVQWRETRGLDHVPVQCRPGAHEFRENGWLKLRSSWGCGAYLRLPEKERSAISRLAPSALPCSECPHIQSQLRTEVVTNMVVSMDTDWRQFLSVVPVGRRGDGQNWTLPLYDTQGILVVGLSQAGKSGVFWALNIGLAPALIAGVVEIRAADPKGAELWHGYRQLGENGFFTEYADDLESIVNMLEESVADMQQRKFALRAAGARKFTPSVETPLVLIEIDELVMVVGQAATDAKLAKRAEKAVIALLTQGRAFGFMVVGGIQDPRMENLGMRPMFQITVALRMANEYAAMVLSREAVKDGGANTAAIPRGADGAGTGYVMDTEASGTQVVQVRAFYADDEAVTAWNDHLVYARGLDQSKRFETAQNASQRVYEAGGGVIPLARPA